MKFAGMFMDVSQLAPSVATDAALMRRITTFFRRSASPGAAVALNRMNAQIDTRSMLPTIRVPTLVIQRAGDREVNVGEERWIASQIPGAKYVELPGDDHLPWIGDSDCLLDEVVAGSGIEFEQRGLHTLKGIPGEWELFSVA